MATKDIDTQYELTGKTTLDSTDAKTIGIFDNGGRWYPRDRYSDYFAHLRSPSRRWPYSLLRSAYTKKFALWLIQNYPEVAVACKLIKVPAAVSAEGTQSAANEESFSPVKHANPKVTA